MDDIIKDDNEKIEEANMIQNCLNSYITKENLIKVLETLDFKIVENFEINIITGAEVKIDRDGHKYVNTLGYKIEMR